MKRHLVVVSVENDISRISTNLYAGVEVLEIESHGREGDLLDLAAQLVCQ